MREALRTYCKLKGRTTPRGMHTSNLHLHTPRSSFVGIECLVGPNNNQKRGNPAREPARKQTDESAVFPPGISCLAPSAHPSPPRPYT
jgi:hypothetical protein